MMSTYEVSVNEIIFIVDAEDEGEAELSVQDILMDVAHDWGIIRVEA